MTKKIFHTYRTLLLCLSTVLVFTTCSEKREEYVEFTKGRQMDPQEPRIGIKLSDDNHVYLCVEKMNSEKGSHALGYHTGKYKFYKSENKIDFSKYKVLVSENFSTDLPKDFIKIEDGTFQQINFNLQNQNKTHYFYDIQLEANQESIYKQIWKLKDKLKFKQIDSMYFHQKLLQGKLPEPPPPPPAQ